MLIRAVLAFMILAGTLFADVKVRDGRVTADLQSQPLTQVLDRLKAQMNMKIVVDEGVAGKTVSAKFQDLPVGLAFKKILEGTGINYAVLTGADGEPQSVFIGGSSRLGAPPRRLDSRPVGNRGVVTPVSPPPPPPAQAPALQPDARQPQPEPPQAKPQIPAVNVPTGGGFVPDKPKTDQPPEQEGQQEEQLDDDNSEE